MSQIRAEESHIYTLPPRRYVWKSCPIQTHSYALELAMRFFYNFIWSPTAWPSLQHTRTKDFEKWKKFLVIVISQPTVSANVGRAKIRRVPQPDQEGRAKEIHCQPYKWISESKNINSFKVIILARFLTNFCQINLTSSTKKALFHLNWAIC